MTAALGLETRLAMGYAATSADAIVVEADEALTPRDTDGVALLAQTGDEGAAAIAAALRAAGGRRELGEIIAVPGGFTGADHVLLTVTVAPSVDRRARGWARTEAYLRSFDHAVALRAKSVALGCHHQRGDTPETVARAAMDAISEHVLTPTRLVRVDLVVSTDTSDVFRSVLRPLLRSPRPVAPPLAALVSTRARSIQALVARALRTAEDDPASLEHLLQACGVGLLTLREGVDPAVRHLLPSDALDLAAWLRREIELSAARGAHIPSDTTWGLRGFGDVRALVGFEHATAEASDTEPVDLRRRYRFLYRMAASPWLSDQGPTLLRNLMATAVIEGVTAKRTTEAAPIQQLRTEPSGTPTSRLRDLLEQQLGERERVHLQAQVDRDRGLRGDDGARLIEFLLHGDPSEVLRDHFTAAHLAALAESVAGLDPDASRDPKRAATAILRALGFSIAGRPEGLETSRQRLEDLRERAARARDSTAIVGVVGEGGHVVERMLKRLLLFQCRHLFEVGADEALRRIGVLGERDVVARASLGKLLHLVLELDRHLRATDELAALRFRALHGERSLLYRRDTDLAAMRNVFAHDRETLEGKTLGDLRTLAARFFEEARAWVDHLTEPVRLYPIMITVVGEEVDRWGRRIVRCVTDEGRDEELHTDHALAVGGRYFMHPTSNPIRVFPLLVSAEDSSLRRDR